MCAGLSARQGRNCTARSTRPATRVAAALAALALVLSGCLSSSQTQDIDYINNTRASYGKSALSADLAAANKAQAWAEHMAATGVLEHTGGGSKLDTSGVSGWCAYGENVGSGPTLSGIHHAFMQSGPHKANILGNWHRVGTGVYRDGGGTVWVTEIYLRNC